MSIITTKNHPRISPKTERSQIRHLHIMHIHPRITPNMRYLKIHQIKYIRVTRNLLMANFLFLFFSTLLKIFKYLRITPNLYQFRINNTLECNSVRQIKYPRITPNLVRPTSVLHKIEQILLQLSYLQPLHIHPRITPKINYRNKIHQDKYLQLMHIRPRITLNRHLKISLKTKYPRITPNRTKI
jgi:hypothetical protein